MDNLELKNWLSLTFPFTKVEDGIDFVSLSIEKEKLFSLMTELKNNETSQFDYLFCETAIDRNSHLEMVYHLTSTRFRHQLMVKTLIEDRNKPLIDSVLPLWKSAELFECEIFDLFGIHFNGHSCRRLFLTDDWIGFPLRKDYNDEVNVVKL